MRALRSIAARSTVVEVGDSIYKERGSLLSSDPWLLENLRRQLDLPLLAVAPTAITSATESAGEPVYRHALGGSKSP